MDITYLTSRLRGIGWRILHADISCNTFNQTIELKPEICNGSNVHSSQRMNIKSDAYVLSYPKTISSTLFTGMFLCLMLFISFTNTTVAQNLTNSGQIDNTGLLKVKNNATGLPSTLNGTFELFGANQNLQAAQYQNVILSGTGTKTTIGGNLSVQKNLTIASPVTLNIPQGNILTLGDTLLESGILKGAIQKSVNLTGSTTSSNFGNIGATISWTSNAPGITNVVRVSDSLHTGNGNQSIKRYYNIQAADATAIGTVILKFSDAELNGQDINTLQLWRSVDNGQNWNLQGGVVDTLLRSISKTNVEFSGRWTMADSLHHIGTSSAPGTPATMAAVSPGVPTGQINTTTMPFSVIIKDAFNTPVKNVLVSFIIDSIPASTSGYALSDTLVSTDSLGIASTTLTFGNKVGIYRVRAIAASLTQILFTAKASHGPASLMTLAKGNNQTKKISTVLDSAFTVSVVDVGGNPVDSATVQFTIVSIPTGASGQQLSNQNVLTDSLGRASTVLTLGNRIGTYSVDAAVTGASGSPIHFSADAVPGNASQILLTLGNDQSAANGTQLADPFTVTVIDAGGNPVQDDTVKFTIANAPSGAIGQQLSSPTSITSASGQATSFLILGNKAGEYLVQAKSNSLGGTLVFRSVSLPGAPSVMNATNGNNQFASINATVANNLKILVLDSSGNAVPSATVTFAITNAPSGATGQSVGTPSASTDTNGTASTSLTLGNKIGTYEVTATIPSLVNAEAISINGKKMKLIMKADKSSADIQVKFTATAISGAPTAINSIAGMNQSKQISTQLDTPFVVHVLDAGGNPVVNTVVNYAITSVPVNATGQQLSISSPSTDSLGEVKSLFTLGNKVGTYEVTASISTASNIEAITIGRKKISIQKVNGASAIEVKFIVSAKPGAAASITAASGSNQSAQVGTQLPNPFVVHVVDAGLNSVPNANVSFAISETPAGASVPPLSTPTAATDSLGNAQIKFTLGNKTGTYKVTATVNGIPSTQFSVTANPGNPSVLSAVVGPQQTRQILSPLSNPFAVRVFDASGNAVPQTAVKFTILSTPQGATGTVMSDSVRMTDSLGQAVATLTLGSKVGAYQVMATVTGTDTIHFTANATHGAAAVLTNFTGQNQIQPTGAMLDTAFALSVHDIGDNPVPNASVRFAVVSVPLNSTGYALSDTVMTTDSSGDAYTYLQLGDRNGMYVVEATVQGVTQAQFSAEGYLMYGDINKDFALNIADITSIIDFVNQKNSLSPVDSLKADFNHDGKIELADIIAIRDSILNRPLPIAKTLSSLTTMNTSASKTKHINGMKKTKAFGEASTLLETTPLGLRVNLQNTVPIRGMEIRIKLNDSTVNINAVNLMTHRGKGMDVFVRTENHEVRVLAYNLTNAEISPDSGSLFRLPDIYNVNAIDTSEVILALQSNTAATSEVFKEVADPSKYPTTFSLGQNYPNPFNGSTKIEYDIADGMKGSKMILQVFNILGQRIKTLVSGEQDPGHYMVEWNGTNDAGMSVASGVYFYRFLTKDHGGSRKMIYLK